MATYIDDAARTIRRLLGYGDEVAAAAPPPMAWDNIQQAAPPAAVDLSLDSPDFGRLAAAADRDAQVVRGQSSNLRNQPFAGVAGQAARESNDARRAAIQRTFENRDMAGRAIPAAAAVAGAYGVGKLADEIKNGGVSHAPAMSSTGGTAELAGESRPAPVVEPKPDEEQAFTDTFKRQYTAREKKREAAGAGGYANKPASAPPAAPKSDPRSEAQALMADLNERRRKAGGEVPDAPQTIARINALLSQSNQQRNSRSPSEASAYAKSNPNDYHAQAQSLIAQLNDMRRQAGGEVPQAQQIMAEVRRLQALGDQQRNAAQTGRY